MNKKELLKKLEIEETRLQEELKQLKELLKVDLSKYEGKTITKRIATHIKKNTNFLNVAITQDSFTIKLNIYSRNNDVFNDLQLIINYNYNDEVLFNYEIFKKEINNYIESKLETLKRIKHNINYIDELIKQYNQMWRLENELSHKMTYIFKDAIDFYKYYRREIEV